MKMSRTAAAIIAFSIMFGPASGLCAEYSEKTATDGEREMHYTCRMRDGAVIVTTERSVAEQPFAKKAPVFIQKERYAPVRLSAIDLANEEATPTRELKSLEEVLIEKLSVLADPWAPDTVHTVTVVAEPQNSVPENERSIRLSRVKSAPKQTWYSKDLFEQVTGSVASLNAPADLEPMLNGKVASIEENQVLVTFSPRADQPIEGPFGPVTVQDLGDHYQIEIDTRKGHLVRVGPLVGRIAEVEPKMFRIDYSHPFGGETLTCDVRVTAVAAKQSGLVVTETPSDPAPLPQAGVEALYAGVAEAAAADHDPEKAPSLSGTGLEMVETGDLAEVAYTASLESGEVVWTTRASIAQDPGQPKVEGYQAPQTLGPESILMGEQGTFPGLNQAIMGLYAGQRQTITLPPEMTFRGTRPELVRQFDRYKQVPKKITLSAEAYVKQFGGFPVKDKIIDYNQYVTGRVVAVTETDAVLEMAPVGETVEEAFGTTQIAVHGDGIGMTLLPKMGAPFEVNGQSGRIVAFDEKQFMVDFGSPLAGKHIVFDVEVLSITKAADFAGKVIPWIEDYEQGLTAAEALQKPAVLVLYADWCGYSKKLFNTTLADPRIKMMQNDFVWVKVDSHKQNYLKELYEQKGYPMTVLLDTHGEVIGSIKGFRPANEFQVELKKALNGSGADPKLKAKNQMKKGS